MEKPILSISFLICIGVQRCQIRHSELDTVAVRHPANIRAAWQHDWSVGLLSFTSHGPTRMDTFFDLNDFMDKVKGIDKL